MMSDNFTLKSHDEIFGKQQCQDSFHVKKLKFNFENHHEILLYKKEK